MPYITSVEEIGYDRGIEEANGLWLERERSLIVRLLTRKVGTISTYAMAQLNRLSIDRLESLGESLLDFNSLEDLTKWLEELEESMNDE